MLCAPALMLCALLIPAGCESAQPADRGDGSTAERQAAEPSSYTELRQRYNQRTDRIEQMWARAVVEPRWVDEEGNRHFEQGDGPLIVRKPGELALVIGKLGEPFFWVGSNGQRFWLFDLKPRDDQPTTAYVGRHERFAELARRDLPLPIRPDRIVDLLGLTSLPPADAVPTTVAGRLQAGGVGLPGGELPGGALELDEGYYVGHTLPGPEGGAPTHAQLMLLDAKYQPRRVVLLPLQGRSLQAALDSGDLPEPDLVAELTGYEKLEQADKGLGQWPAVPTRIEATIPGREAELKINLSDMTDGKRRDKIRDVQFDFDRLLEIHNPERVRELRAETAAGEAEPEPTESQ